MADGRQFGTIINERRLELGYSLGQLANRIGTTASQVRAWERGDEVPDDVMVGRIAGELDLSGGELRSALSPLDGGAAAPSGRVDTDAVEDATAAVMAPVFSDASDTLSAARDEDRKEEAVEPKPAPIDAQIPEEELPEEEPPEAGLTEADVPSEGLEENELGVEEPTAAPPDPILAEPTLPEPIGPEPPIDAEPEAEVTGEPGIEDLPTEAVPAVDPPPPEFEAPVPVMVPPVTGVAVATAEEVEEEGIFPEWTRLLRTIFDPEKRYHFWLRTGLTIVVMLIFLRVLAWAVPAFFDTVSDILDTIESTDDTILPGISDLDLDGVNLDDLNLEDLDLEGIDLDNLDLEDLDLENLDLENLDLEDLTGTTPPQG